MKRGNRAALLALVGLVLLANGAWAYPAGPAPSYEYTATYEAEPTEPLPDESWGSTAPAVDHRDCRFDGPERSCALSRYVADDGPVPVEAAIDPPLYGPDYVTLGPDRHYRTVERVDDGRLVLDLEPVPRDRLALRLAVNYSDARPTVVSAVANGTATRTVPLDEREFLPDPAFVDRNGTVYYVSVAETERTPTGWGWKAPPRWVVELFRLSGWVGGAALLVQAGRVSVP